jgi:glucose-1-phosphate cytidylyltransferase
MKLVILAGGYGTRLIEETISRPKPLVEIGQKPIIWHIMKYYSKFGINKFIICCGYKGEMLKSYFLNYKLNNSDIELNLNKNEFKILKKNNNNWDIKLIDTGLKTLTGGRIRRIKDYINKNENFCMTYGDGLSDVNIKKLINFHKKQNKIATITAVKQPVRFGILDLNKNMVKDFSEKSKLKENWINGGFFVLNEKIFNYLKNDKTIFEKEPLKKLSKKNQLSAFRHKGFWYAMDSMRDKEYLENLWENNKSPWKIWND